MIQPIRDAERERKLRFVRAMLECSARLPRGQYKALARALKAKKISKRAIREAIKLHFSGVEFHKNLAAVLADTPLVVWGSWNDYMTLASCYDTRRSLYARCVLDLATTFVLALNPELVSDEVSNHWVTAASLRDKWPGFYSTVGVIQSKENEKLKKFRLSRKHGCRGRSTSHELTLPDSRIPAGLTELWSVMKDSPAIVRKTNAVYRCLVTAHPDDPAYADLLLYLACEFVAAVDPALASPPLLRNLVELSRSRLSWPAWLTRPKREKHERRKYRQLPLGAAKGIVKVHNDRGITAIVADRLFTRLWRLSQEPFWRDACAGACQPVDGKGTLCCASPQCPWRGRDFRRKAWNAPHMYWDYHYISKLKPPFDSAEKNREVWIKVARTIFDAEHGTPEIREATRRRHLEELRNNPRVVFDARSQLHRRAKEQNRRRSSERFVTLALHLASVADKREAVQRKKAALLPLGAKDQLDWWPCAMADPEYEKYYYQHANPYVKNDFVRYKQVLKDVLGRLADRLPKPREQ